MNPSSKLPFPSLDATTAFFIGPILRPAHATHTVLCVPNCFHADPELHQPDELSPTMNDAASPSYPAPLDARLDDTTVQSEPQEASQQQSNAGPSTTSRSRAGSYISRSRAGSHINGRRRRRKSRKKRNPGLVKKLEFVTHLLKSLDTLVFAELSALYYME